MSKMEVSTNINPTMKITMLGTGHATVTRCYNTCFVLEQTAGDGTCRLLVDAGGGNGILAQLEKAGIPLRTIHDVFITHAHTDHLLGCVWVVRMVMQMMLDDRYDGTLNVYSHEKCLRLLRQICEETLHSDYSYFLGQRVLLHELNDGDEFHVGSMRLQCFDIHSRKEKQFGFIMGKQLACLGDEPFNEQCRGFVESAEWLMSEAFCLYEDRDRFQPYEKHHSTVLDAARLAEELQVKNLILYHTEDRTLDTRRERYTMEAKKAFRGQVFVPDDLESITL